LATAQNILQEAVEIARSRLEGHPFLDVVAREAAKNAGRRGEPFIVIDDDGSVMLEVRYDSTSASAPKKGKVKAKAKESLPSMDKLREQAATLNVDISDLGRAKKKIMERLMEARKAKLLAVRIPKPKMMKTAPALSVTPVTPPKPKIVPKPPADSLAAIASQGSSEVQDMDEWLASLDD
jgi:hypothetical protein